MSACVVAIASGKGGTGKSLLVANLGIFLASLGKRVVVIDAAFGTASLHLYVGVPSPRTSVYELAHGRALVELAIPTPMPGLALVSGVGSGPVGGPASAEVAQRLVDEAKLLDADWVLLDLGATAAPETLKLFWRADLQLVVALPDPTSVEPMYRFICDAYFARIGALGLTSPRDGTPLEFAQRTPRDSRAVEALLEFTPLLVMNSCRSKADMELGRAVASIARRRLGIPMQYVGHLEYDEAVWAATRRKRPLLVEHPETRIARNIERVTRALLGYRAAEAETLLPPDGHYDVLEVHPTASFEDIRRANRRMREIYGPDAIAISGLYEPADLEAVHRRLDIAYTTLMDASKRRDYDREIFPDGVPLPTVPAPASEAEPRRARDAAGRPHAPTPILSEYSGAALRDVREAQGLTLREISERSKIGLAYLHAIEDEEFGKLPAPVYVRGFVMEYARVLRLPPDVVAASYLRRVA